MSVPDPGSVSRLLEDLRSADLWRRDAAATEIWNRYYPELLRIAAAHLSPRIRQRTDPEDVLQSVYKSFCARMIDGDLPGVGSRDGLIRTIVDIARKKSASVARHHSRHKRDVRREQMQVANSPASQSDDWDFYAGLEQGGPSSEEAVCYAETVEQYLNALPEALRPIVLMKVEGYTDEEMGEKLRCSVRTVERKKRLIREYWQKLAPGPVDD